MRYFTGVDCRLILLFLLLTSGVCVTSAAPRAAIVVAAPTATATSVADSLANELKAGVRIIDRDLAATVFSSLEQERPFNPEREVIRTFGAAAGVEFLILIRGETLPRFSFEKKDYFESFAAVFLFATRDGELRLFKLLTCSEETTDKAGKCLLSKAAASTSELTAAITKVAAVSAGLTGGDFPQPPDPESPVAKSFRSPLPYRRLTPKYTAQAALYGVTATVDVEVDFDAEGRIAAMRFVRWAGFGLEESVTEAIRAMNWRPALLNGKPVPVRALLRYNFKKIEKEDD